MCESLFSYLSGGWGGHLHTHTCTRAHTRTHTHTLTPWDSQWHNNNSGLRLRAPGHLPSISYLSGTRSGPSVIFLFLAHPWTFRQTTQFGEEIHRLACVCPKFPWVHGCQRLRAPVLLCPKYTVKVQISAPVPQHPDALLPSAGRF